MVRNRPIPRQRDVNVILTLLETSRKFIIAKLPIRKLAPSSVLIMPNNVNNALLALMKIRAYGSKAMQ